MNTKQKYDTVVLFSGGLDSSVLAYKLHKEGKRIRLLHIDFGKEPGPSERSAAKRIAFELGVPLEIVSLHGITDMEVGIRPLDVYRADELDVKKLI